MSYNYIVPWSVQHISPFPSSFRFVVVSFYLGDFFCFQFQCFVYFSMFRVVYNCRFGKVLMIGSLN